VFFLSLLLTLAASTVPRYSTPSHSIVHRVWYCSRDTAPVHRYYSSTAATDSLSRAVTMPDNTGAAALRARLEAIVKKAKDAEAQAAALEQMATTAHQLVPSSSSSSSSPAVASQLIPTASSTYEDTVVARFHLQAAVVLNIRQLVNIVLDSSSTNYASWRDLMEQTLQCYTLIKHVTNDALSNDLGWIRMDNVVLN
jgi:hypothetical protein